jgi:hypothetical protein
VTFDSLSAQIDALGSTLGLDTAPLLAKISAAANSAARGNSGAAANQLGAFINQVQAMERSRRLDAATAAQFIAAAQSLIR